jgi:hypothetical protein
MESPRGLKKLTHKWQFVSLLTPDLPFQKHFGSTRFVCGETMKFSFASCIHEGCIAVQEMHNGILEDAQGALKDAKSSQQHQLRRKQPHVRTNRNSRSFSSKIRNLETDIEQGWEIQRQRKGEVGPPPSTINIANSTMRSPPKNANSSRAWDALGAPAPFDNASELFANASPSPSKTRDGSDKLSPCNEHYQPSVMEQQNMTVSEPTQRPLQNLQNKQVSAHNSQAIKTEKRPILLQDHLPKKQQPVRKGRKSKSRNSRDLSMSHRSHVQRGGYLEDVAFPSGGMNGTFAMNPIQEQSLRGMR